MTPLIRIENHTPAIKNNDFSIEPYWIYHLIPRSLGKRAILARVIYSVCETFY